MNTYLVEISQRTGQHSTKIFIKCNILEITDVHKIMVDGVEMTFGNEYIVHVESMEKLNEDVKQC